MAEQLRDPLRVSNIGLAPRHGLDVLGIHDDELEAAFEHVVDRFPVAAGGLYRNGRDVRDSEPIGEFEQKASRRRSKRLEFTSWVASWSRGQPTGDDDSLVDVEPGAVGVNDLHGALLGGRPAGALRSETASRAHFTVEAATDGDARKHPRPGCHAGSWHQTRCGFLIPADRATVFMRGGGICAM